MKRTLSKAIALTLMLALIAPSAFLVAPQRAYAQSAGSIAGAISCFSSLLGIGTSAIGSIGGALSFLGVPVRNTVIEGATSNNCIYDTIIMPLARLLARIVLMQITAKVISWITGNNSTGQPMFVTNLPGYMQQVGDNRALAFFVQFGKNSNSPFAGAINSALRLNYLQSSSLAGFFVANQNTLGRYSPNVNAFLSGNWSQGGIPAWFALTTQPQNNPYTFYYESQNQLASVIGSAQAAQAKVLDWGNGFRSWCGERQGPAPDDPDNVIEGTAPGDSCLNSDGTWGTVQTPSSIIHGYTQSAVVDSGLNQLINSQDLDAALGAIVTALAGQVLGGVGGLLGAATVSGSRPAFTTQLQSYTGSAAGGTGSIGSVPNTKFAQIDAYISSWNTIMSAANIASSSLQSLANFCTEAASDPEARSTFTSAARAQAQNAQDTITIKVAPVLAQAQSAIAGTAEAQALAQKVQAEASNPADPAYTTDLQTLIAMPPTIQDVLAVQSQTQSTGLASASPAGSLNVSGGTIVEQMNVLAANASTLKTTACTPSGTSVNNRADGSD